MDPHPRPLLFLDVDGPLIPFGANLNPALGPLLTNLPCELIWATTWAEEANRTLCPALGLPTLEVMAWPDDGTEPIDHWFGLHWKTRGLVTRAAGRAFVWIDDELTDHDRDWVSQNHSGSALLYGVNPRVGLRPNDFTEIARWLGGLRR